MEKIKTYSSVVLTANIVVAAAVVLTTHLSAVPVRRSLAPLVKAQNMLLLFFVTVSRDDGFLAVSLHRFARTIHNSHNGCRVIQQ